MIELRTRTEGNDLLELLLSCHERIRRFSATALRLLETPDATDADIADAASRVHRYFTVAFPLHVIDEEESIRPRIERTGDDVLITNVVQMSAEHVAADLLLEELVPEWEAIAARPEHAREHAERLIPLTRALIDEFEPHLRREETVIFPRMTALLGPEACEEIVGELRERRRDLHAKAGPAVASVVSLKT